jgi:hypothetical protein
MISARICLPVFFIPSSLRSPTKSPLIICEITIERKGGNPPPLLKSSELSVAVLSSA